MIRIGEFAKICGTSIQTLRYYDSCGILRADFVDPDSGYRMYAPEAVEKYKLIRFYQELGFTLSEIKKLLSARDEEKKATLLSKKKELNGALSTEKSRIAQIDEMCQSPTLSYPMFYEMTSLPFEDDPEVLGKWKLCGKSPNGKTITSLDGESAATADDEMVFLPGGACYWKYFWSKGVAYRIHPTYHFAVPNEYRIETVDGKRLLFLNHVSNACIDDGAESVFLVYEQTFHGALTEMTARKHIDRVDLPYTPDPEVVGKWQTCDYIDRIENFDPEKQMTTRDCFWILGLRFGARGLLWRTQLEGSERRDYLMKYTGGYVLNEQALTAEEYQIRQIGGEEYLFVQHKSGDYYYGGKAPHYYVFKRTQRGEDHNGSK